MGGLLEGGQRGAKLVVLVALLVAGIIIPHVVVFGANLAIDPYAIVYRYKTDRLLAYNCGETREFKPYWMRDPSYNAIAIGSSRVNLGINPTLEKQLHPDMKLFNAGTPSGDLHEIRRFLQEVKYLPNYKTVFVLLDLSMLDAGDRNLSYFSENRMLSTENGGKTPAYLNWSDVVSKSMEAGPLIDVSLGLCPSFNESDGFRAPNYAYTPKLWYERAMDTYVRYYKGVFKYAETGENSVSSELPYIKDVIASRPDVKFYFVFSPLHWIINGTIFRVGKDHAFFDYRKKFVERLAEFPNVETWDFAIASPATISPIPKSDEEWRGGFYKEPSHFAPRLGHIVIDEVLSGKENYGRKVTPSNFADIASEIRTSYANWEESWPDIDYYNSYYQMLLDRFFKQL